MELAPPSRWFALVDHDEAATDKDRSWSIVSVWLTGDFEGAWSVSGFRSSGGVTPLDAFDARAEAFAHAEERFPQRGVWQPVPPAPDRDTSWPDAIVPGSHDWRIENLESHVGAKLHWELFDAIEGDDHDHCEGCTAKLMATRPAYEPGVIRAGFDSSAGGWICAACYHDLKEVLRFRAQLPE